MKRFLILSLVLGVGVGLGQFSQGVAAEAEGGGAGFREAASQNGDVNCDGEVQLSDAVFILNWLFLGGRAPCPPADPPKLLARIVELDAELLGCRSLLKNTTADLAAAQAALSQSETTLAECRNALSELEGSLVLCETQQAGNLPATVQSGCFDATGNQVDCSAQGCPGQDGFYQAGCPPEGRFVEFGKDSVIHESATLGQIGQTSGGFSVIGTKNAHQFFGSRFRVPQPVIVEAVGGHLRGLDGLSSDIFAALVRLPSATGFPRGSPFAPDELIAATVVNAPIPSGDVLWPLSATLAPGHYALIFGSAEFGAGGQAGLMGNNSDIPGSASYFLWNGPGGAWQDTGNQDNMRFVVRGSVVEPESIVIDLCTGLMWQKNTADLNGDGQITDDDADAVAWCQALDYCEHLVLGGYDDWRLPNIRELQSIVDYERFIPAIDAVFGAFSAFSSSYYWSSTSEAASPGSAWCVDFGSGVVSINGKDGQRAVYVRAVRPGP